MPLFYFDVLEVDGRVSEDHFGVDLPTEAEAVKQANATLAEMVKEEIAANVDFQIRIRIADADGREIVCRRADISKGDFD